MCKKKAFIVNKQNTRVTFSNHTHTFTPYKQNAHHPFEKVDQSKSLSGRREEKKKPHGLSIHTNNYTHH